jgi:hypothetical protein
VADYFLRVWNDLGARVSGPLSLRLFQKPSLALVAVLCFASIAIAQEPLPSDSPEEERAPVQASTDKWQFAVTPYAFLPRLTGTVGVLNQTAQVNASFSDIFSNLNFAAMGTFEARKKNWTVLVDGMYMSLSGQKVTPSPFFSDIDVKVKEIVITPEVGYRVLQLEKGSIDILGGVRIWHVKSHLTFQPRILPLVDVEGTKNWADPIVGARGTVTVSPRTFLRGEFDAGGFGVGSNFTGQVFGGAGFQFKPRVALIGGYRYLRTDYVNDNFVFRTALSGVIIGAQFKL